MSKAAFAIWLREPHINLRGTIQQVDGPKQKAFIRPDAFPEERLLFWYGHWTITRQHRSLANELVLFDVDPQPDWHPKLNAQATNVRLLVTPPSPETRPTYTTSG